jgi:hypothetical protein
MATAVRTSNLNAQVYISQWHYATSQKVVGLNPDEVIGFYN